MGHSAWIQYLAAKRARDQLIEYMTDVLDWSYAEQCADEIIAAQEHLEELGIYPPHEESINKWDD